MNKLLSVFLYPLSFLLLILYNFASDDTKHLVEEDVKEMCIRMNKSRGLVYWLVHFPAFRNLFYYRVPKCRCCRFLFHEYSNFEINCKDGIGGGAFVLNHPFSTIINAKKIGKNFTCCQCTTIGNKLHGRNDLIPTIGDNVSLGANVLIIGDVQIGNNVIVGAGSVVVKNIPDNSVVAGNPARVIRSI